MGQFDMLSINLPGKSTNTTFIPNVHTAAMWVLLVVENQNLQRQHNAHSTFHEILSIFSKVTAGNRHDDIDLFTQQFYVPL